MLFVTACDFDLVLLMLIFRIPKMMEKAECGHKLVVFTNKTDELYSSKIDDILSIKILMKQCQTHSSTKCKSPEKLCNHIHFTLVISFQHVDANLCSSIEMLICEDFLSGKVLWLLSH